MFKRIVLEDWTLCIPAVSFVIFALVFALVTWRALRLKKSERDRLAALPLDSADPTKPPSTQP